MALRLVGVIFSACIIKRGLWKIKHIDGNRNLVKDEAWKDIHMTVPRRIVKYTIISMCIYILYESISLFRAALMQFGFSDLFYLYDQEHDICLMTTIGSVLYYSSSEMFNVTMSFGFLILQ